jgi:hypothetical protein
MIVACGEHWHNISPTGLVVVVEAFMAGELHAMTSAGVGVLCLARAFTVTRVVSVGRRYKGNVIRCDDTEYGKVLI